MIIYQTNLVRKEQKASVLPYLRISFANGALNSIPYQQLILTNEGLGPAKIEEVNIIEGEKKVAFDILHHLELTYSDTIYSHILISDLVNTGRQIAAKDYIIMVRTKNKNKTNLITNTYKFPDYLSKFFLNDAKGEAVIQIIYSSVYGDKWIIQSDEDQPVAIE